MDGARALPAAEHPEQEGKGAVHGRRHGEAGQHDQRAEHEQHDEIGQLLQRVVVLRRLALGKLQLGMGDDLVRQMLEVRLRRQQFLPEVAAEEDISEIGEAVE